MLHIASARADARMRSKGINKGKEPVFRNMECIVIEKATWRIDTVDSLRRLRRITD